MTAIINKHRVEKIVKKLASPAIVFYALPWLMILLCAGTVAQKYIGLYKAQAQYFSDWFLWIGFIPLPGAYLTLALITLALVSKFLFYSPWKKQQAGTIISHLGVLVLLIGGLVTGTTQKEGFLILGEDSTVSSLSEYHARVVTIEKNEKESVTIDFENINDLKTTQLPFKISILSRCDNCRPQSIDAKSDRKGLAAIISLGNIAEEKEAEANLAGLEFGINGAPENQDGVYAIMEEIPHRPVIVVGNDSYRFSIGRRQEKLPFQVMLKKFVPEYYPGTNMARSFSSSVLIQDGDIEWPYTIRMNEPLRYKGYTFYQSSFSVRPDGTYSILNVVQNKGRALPYVASILVFGGLLTHLVIRIAARRKADT